LYKGSGGVEAKTTGGDITATVEVACGDGVRGARRAVGGRRADDPAGFDAERQGRRPVPDRVCFDAIVFVLVTGIAWAHLPRELGCSGTTAWRRLRDWQASGAWERLHATLLDRHNAAGAIDWSMSVVDGSHIRALQGGPDRAVSG
jgi:transposase